LPALAILFSPSAIAQGTIVYVHAPLSNPNGDPNHLPWDSLGTQVGPDFHIVVNGQTILTFSTPIVVGQPSAFVVQALSTSVIIGQQPFVDFPDVWAVPLSAGIEVGPSAATYGWSGGGLLTAAIDGGVIGQPPLTVGYFTGLESAYLGFQFQNNGDTYYGWARVGCPIAELNVGWIYDYAYETSPNTPIVTGTVPEPGIPALLLVSAMTLWHLRRQHGEELTRYRGISAAGDGIENGVNAVPLNPE
jgi:hypothetical protein